MMRINKNGVIGSRQTGIHGKEGTVQEHVVAMLDEETLVKVREGGAQLMREVMEGAGDIMQFNMLMGRRWWRIISLIVSLARLNQLTWTRRVEVQLIRGRNDA
jgi:hypothetical protein